MKTKNVLAGVILGLTISLAGCGTTTASEEDLLAGMKQFELSNESASLYLDKDWETQDTGLDTMLAAGTSNGSEAVFMDQFPKGSSYYPVESLDDVKKYVSDNFQASDEEEVEAFEIPGMSNVSVTKCKISSGGVNADACMAYGETENAYYTIIYMTNHWNDSKMASFKVSCKNFAESGDAFEEEDATTAELTDTIRWFNAACAILTELNGQDYNRFAGLPANETTQKMAGKSLEEWWEVTDRASADETLDWVLNEGHRTDFQSNMESLDQAGIKDAADRKSFILENYDVTDEEAEKYAENYEMYEQYGADAITGWDYCRALNLLSMYYLAGYYTEQEALDQSLEIAKTM